MLHTHDRETLYQSFADDSVRSTATQILSLQSNSDPKRLNENHPNDAIHPNNANHPKRLDANHPTDANHQLGTSSTKCDRNATTDADSINQAGRSARFKRMCLKNMHTIQSESGSQKEWGSFARQVNPHDGVSATLPSYNRAVGNDGALQGNAVTSGAGREGALVKSKVTKTVSFPQNIEEVKECTSKDPLVPANQMQTGVKQCKRKCSRPISDWLCINTQEE